MLVSQLLFVVEWYFCGSIFGDTIVARPVNGDGDSDERDNCGGGGAGFGGHGGGNGCGGCSIAADSPNVYCCGVVINYGVGTS